MICHLCQKELTQVNSYGHKDKIYIFACINKDCFRPPKTEYKIVTRLQNNKITIFYYALTFPVQDNGFYKITSSELSEPFTTLYEINGYSKLSTQREIIKISKFFPLNQEDVLSRLITIYDKLKSLLVFS